MDEKFVHEQAQSHSHFEHDGEGEDERSKMLPRVWSRGQGRAFEEAFEVEEERWRVRGEKGVDGGGGSAAAEEEASFEKLRRVGSSGM